MDLELRDRTVVVGGASRGIGYAIAKSFVAEGACVIITGRNETALARAVGELQLAGQVTGVAADLTTDVGVAAVLQRAREAWDRVDVLVANVGSGAARAGWALTDDDWNGAFAANFHAGRRLAEATLPGMIAAGRGSIVFIASIVGLESVNAPLTYSAAKAALISYAKNLAREVARHGVRINAVAPGNVMFDGGTWARKLAEQPERVRQYIETEVPAARFGTPQEIADVVTFLASERAAFVTGACVVADGGQTRRY